MSVGEASDLVKRCECLKCCPSEWKIALYMGERKCLRPPPWFKDVFF